MLDSQVKFTSLKILFKFNKLAQLFIAHHGTPQRDHPYTRHAGGLVAKGGAARLLRINRAGDVIAAEQAE